MRTTMRALLMLTILFSLTASASALPPWKAKFKEMFVDDGPQTLQAAFADKVIGSCKTCHVNGEEKTVRNSFGIALDRMIDGNAGERLKKAAKEGADAKAAMQARIDKEMLAALDKVLKQSSPTGGGSYGERIKAGKLPFVPNNVLSDREKTDGWQLLFDGKSADGWYSWKTKQPLKLDKWDVADGTLALKRGGGDVYTAEPFENFELVLEWKTKGNSGILIRVDPTAKGPIYGVAPEVQIERTMGDSKTSTAALYDIYPVTGKKEINADGWNKVRIRLVNGEGTHWFNGHEVYSYKIGSDDWNQRIANSKWRNSKGFGLTAKGHIGLQDHGAQVWFRNIKIRPLQSE